MSKRCYGFVCAVIAVLIGSGFTPEAQSPDPSTLPVIQFADLQYLGAFRLPREFANGDSFAEGGGPVTFNPSRNSLFIGNHHGRIAEVSIPAPVNSSDVTQLPFSSFLQGFYEPTGGMLAQITGSEASISGLLVMNDRMYGSASIYYDANNIQRVSHYSRPTTLSTSSGLVGMRQVWIDEHSGFVSGFMATVPPEWQQKLGGPAVTGQCCIPIAWRTSWGPSAFAFNPADINTVAKVPAQPLVYYSSEHRTLGSWDGAAPIYNASTEITGVAILAGTRTALYVGRTGTGPICYGIGTNNQSIVGTMSPDGAVYCYDPTNDAKSQHNYPYQYQIWAYDLNDLAAVKAGTKQPWDVKPYGVWPFGLPFAATSMRIGGIGYDASRQLLYVSQLHADRDGYEYRPLIHVLKVGGGAVGTPLPPPDTTPLPPVPTTSGATTGVRITALSIAASKTAPQPAGTSISFTATPTGGISPHQYKWLVHNGLQWTEMTGWTTANTYVWTPATPNPYRVGVWVRSSGNGADVAEFTQSVDFLIGNATNYTAPYEATKSVTLTANKTAPQPAGSMITWTATAGGGQAPHQYKWLVHNGLQWTVAGEWSTSNTFVWTPAVGNSGYRIGVWARSSRGTADAAEATNSADFAITTVAGGAAPPPPSSSTGGRLTALALTANKPAPQPAATTITFTATPTGGVTPHQYKWLVHNGLQWSIVSDWSTSNTYNWTPASSNAGYRVGVWVRSAGLTADSPEFTNSVDFPITAALAAPVPAPAPPPTGTTTTGRLTSVSLTANKTAPQPAATTVTFTATPTGGATPHQYKWLVHNGLQWSVASEWSTINTFNWTPATSNAGYRVGVWVRSAGLTADAPEMSNSVDFAISAALAAPAPEPAPAPSGTAAQLTAVTIGANKIAPQPAGTTIMFSATPNGGAAPQQYKWLVHNGVNGWSAVTGWSTVNTFNWTPAGWNAGYRVGVWVRAAGKTADAPDATNSMDFPISAGTYTPPPPPPPTSTGALTAVRIASDKPAPQAPGTAITFTATPTGGAAPHQYKWLVHNGLSWNVVSGWSTANTFVWTPDTMNGAYRIGVWVRTAGNTVDAGEMTMSIDFPIFR